MLPAAVLACMLAPALLGGCAPTTEPPVSANERASIGVKVADTEWSSVIERYPEALRPDTVPGSTLADHDWAAATVACLQGGGFRVKQDGTKFRYSSSNGQSPIDFAVTSYSCSLRHARLGAVVSYLDSAQRGQLYDYLDHVVRPCLAVAGERSSTAPGRAAYVDSFPASEWHPYDLVWLGKPGRAALDRLEARCPPVPSWLDLAPTAG